ncbi:MAG: chloride channel protein [Methanobacteriota archaeon]
MFEQNHHGFHINADKRALRRFGLLSGLAASVGILVGIGAVLFRYLLAFFNNIFLETRFALDYDPYATTVSTLGWLVILAPAIGGLFAGLVTWKFAPEAKGHGVPEVMESMLTKEGKIRPRVGLVKAVASALTIGSGGSAGREGPMVQIGSASGSGIAQKLGLSDDETKVLLACGAASGVAATFNTPIGGVLFALELVLLEFRTRSFVPIVISTMIATFVAQAFFGNEVALPIRDLYEFSSPYEIPLYVLLGIICGVMAIVFIKMLYGMEWWVEKWRMRPYLKPMIGGLLVGVLGLALFTIQGDYYVFGVSYGAVYPVLKSEVVSGTMLQLMLLLALLAFLKMLATTLTIGTGGSGGIFSPMLIFGAMIGGAFGIAMNLLFPGTTAPFGAYALVGMAALFAGASRATLTAIVILFEMTSSYSIILPLMLACVVSDAVSSAISEDTVYTLKLKLRGLRYSGDREVNIMEIHSVSEVMACPPVTITPETKVSEVSSKIIKTGYQGFPVVDAEGKLCGIVTLSDVRGAINAGKGEMRICEAMPKREPEVVYPDQSVEEVLEIMSSKGYGRMPVVDREDKTKLLGLVTRSRILMLYKDRKKHQQGGWT